MGKNTRLCRCLRRCGGSLVQDKAFNRPRFTCTKCGHTFTNGLSGEPYASAVPFAPPKDDRRPTPPAEGGE